MFFLKIMCMLSVIWAVNCDCSYTSWRSSFDSRGQSKCNERSYYIRGLTRVGRTNDGDIRNLDGVDCCPAPTNWSNTDVLVVYEDWTHRLDGRNVLAQCPSGYFIQGLYRSDAWWQWSAGLAMIENARCAKPATHPFYYGDCYAEDIANSFNREGKVSCRAGYYLIGLYKSDCNDLHCLDQLQCCEMADRPREINNIDVFKNHIMDTTLIKMANLAHMLGYGWCYGNRGVNVGEDFERVGDKWVASTKSFFPSSSCEGVKCTERLNLEYSNWGFDVKDIKYGQRLTDNLELESVDSGTIHNNHNTEATESLQLSKTVEETITHTATNTRTNSHEVGISLDFQIPVIGGPSISYKTSYESSISTTNENRKHTSTTFTRSASKTLPPFSSAKYKVMLSKSRTTIPYTAVIIAKFSTQFRGFLRKGESFTGSTTNYHSQYKGSEARPTFPYSFGSPSLPFYRALKNQVDSQSSPWLWNEMLKNYPSGREVVNALTNEGQYEITLSGILEHVRGTEIDVVWENVIRTRRGLHDDTTHKPILSKNGTIFAFPGPNDHPVKVEFPKVQLVTAQPTKFETFRADKDSV